MNFHKTILILGNLSIAFFITMVGVWSLPLMPLGYIMQTLFSISIVLSVAIFIHKAFSIAYNLQEGKE